MADPLAQDKWTFEKDQWYELTICPNNQYQYSLNRHTKIYKALEEIFDECDFKYLLLPEISMPQSNHKNNIPRLHYHGMIKFTLNKHIVKWLLKDALKVDNIGLYQFNPFRGEHWPKYICKHQYLFKRLNITITNMFDQEILDQLDIAL